MISRALRLATAVTLAAVGVGLLVTAYGAPGPDSPASAVDTAIDAAIDPEARTGGPPADAQQLLPSVPRRAGSGSPPATAPDPGDVPPAATGRALPPQWPEFRPTRLTLRPGTGDAPAPVDPVGVTSGRLALPDDADRVGWWTGGATAGAPFGTVVIAGHLDSASDPAGHLAGLTTLAPDDLVDLATTTKHQRYRVVSNYLLPSADLSRRSDLFEQRRPHRLLLITCGGPYDHERGRYRDNRIVEAVPVPA